MDGRRYCHRCVAQLPPEAREIYRSRADRLAERWYREGAARRAMDCSAAWSTRRSAVPGATTRWSSWATWRSRTGGSARRWRCTASWCRTGPTIPFALVHPDPVGRPGRGSRPRNGCAGPHREARRAGPTSRNSRGDTRRRRAPGRPQRAPTRRSWPHSLAADRLETPGQPDGRWPTFAGSPRRTRIVPGPIDVGQVQWRVEIEKVSTTRSRISRFGAMREPGGRPAAPAPSSCWPSTRSCWAIR